MAVQEALILLLRASLPTSGFTQVPSLSLCACVRVAFPCLLSPPLSLIPLSACLSCALSVPLRAFSLLFLVLSRSFDSAVSSFAPLLVFFTGQDKVRYSFYDTQKGFCVCLLACLAGCFFLLFPHLSFSSFSPRCPPLCLAGACVARSRLWQAERRKMKAQSSKMHQHEY